MTARTTSCVLVRRPGARRFGARWPRRARGALGLAALLAGATACSPLATRPASVATDAPSPADGPAPPPSSHSPPTVRSTAIPAAAPPATQAAGDPPNEADEALPLTIRVRGYRVSDSDGSRPARVAMHHVQAWVRVANEAFAAAGFALELDIDQPLDDLQSTIVNRAMPDRKVPELDAALRPLLERHPGELLVLFRHGPRREPTTLAFSGLYLDYIVMPGFEGTHHCGHDQLDALAHELGHFLGLPHTFTQTFPSPQAAEAFLRSRGGDPLVFDGDGLSDTAPDPGIVPMECSDEPAVELAGTRFELPRDNLMSYYRQRRGLSPQQLARARWAMGERVRGRMTIAVNAPPSPLELEQMASSGRPACRPQRMTSFLDNRWSGDAQQFCVGPSRFRFSVPQAGRYGLQLYATRAPDFGRLQVELDGRDVGKPYEAWAPVVLPSGPIPLAAVELDRGAHTIGFRVVGRHPEATADKYGVDALELLPLPSPEPPGSSAGAPRQPSAPPRPPAVGR